MRVIIIAVCFLIGALAQAQDLPESVTTPYVAYETAMQAGNEQAAAEAAEQVWRAAQAANVDPDTQMILADNAGQALLAVGQYEAALEAIDFTARLLNETGADPLLIGVAEPSALKILA